ncbi:MAG: peptidase M23 [uncultured bacterium]|nr:MAG: peptidase M23 [uncultured bacterium]
MNGYHIIVVPNNAANTKRLHLSSLTMRLVGLLAILLLPTFVGAIFMTLHYQNKVALLQNQMIEENQIIEQKEILASKISALERALSKTQVSMEQLKGDLTMDVSSIQAGVGPIEPDGDVDNKAALFPKVTSQLGDYLEKGGKMSLPLINTKLHAYDEEIETLQSDIQGIYTLNEDKIKFLASMPNVMPVDGWITSNFGFRHHPYSGINKMHYGIDVASPTGTIVRAPADGKVLVANYAGGYGREVVLDHGFGVNTVYGHASELFVKEGDFVKKGEPLAAVGSTGSSTGPHLHYEVHVDGIPTDPLQFVFKQ